jgi:ketosteroid isomerase-like protein
MNLTIDERLDRVEAVQAIQQLAFRYALAVDMRDLDSLAGLFVDDIVVSASSSGRESLRCMFAEILRRFDSTAHFVSNHIIDFVSRSAADGVVYTRAEHEIDSRWVVAQLVYWDHYVSRDGRWYFGRRRTPLFWYVADLLEPPIGKRKIRWPGQEPLEGTMHELAPSWSNFESFLADEAGPVPPPADIDRFLEVMRAGSALPRGQFVLDSVSGKTGK